VLLQKPQLFSSSCRFLHMPPQLDCPPGQFSWQLPPMQVWLTGQLFAHSPQLASSLLRFLHAPAQQI
jgi:hypothetical protein